MAATGGDGGGVDGRGGAQVEVGEAFDAGEASFGDAPLAAPFGALVDLGGEHLGQERHVAHLGALGDLGQAVGVGADHLGQRDLHAGPDLGHEPAHGRLADLHAVLVDEPLPHSPGRVTLLAGRALVCLEPPDDQRLPRVQHARSGRRFFPNGRHRRGQRLAHRAAVNPEPARQLVDRHPLPLAPLPDLPSWGPIR
jgi:hypothetical protein